VRRKKGNRNKKGKFPSRKGGGEGDVLLNIEKKGIPLSDPQKQGRGEKGGKKEKFEAVLEKKRCAANVQKKGSAPLKKGPGGGTRVCTKKEKRGVLLRKEKNSSICGKTQKRKKKRGGGAAPNEHPEKKKKRPSGAPWRTRAQRGLEERKSHPTQPKGGGGRGRKKNLVPSSQKKKVS